MLVRSKPVITQSRVFLVMTRSFSYSRATFSLKLPWANQAARANKSDKSICEEVLEVLGHCPSLVGDQISVQVREGTVELTGNVASWENRRLAGDAAWSVSGVDDVVNELQVDRF